MPQGSNKSVGSSFRTKQKHRKPQKVNSHKNWKKRKDPVRAVMIKKAESVAIANAMKDPLKGGIRTSKDIDEALKFAKESTKQLIKEAERKR